MYEKFSEYYQKKKDLLKLLHSQIQPDESDDSELENLPDLKEDFEEEEEIQD